MQVIIARWRTGVRIASSGSAFMNSWKAEQGDGYGHIQPRPAPGMGQALG